MVFVDFDLARRLEGVETWVAGEFGRARTAIRPGEDTAVVDVAGGVACYLGEGSPVNEARGMGMAGPVSADELGAMEGVFFSRGVAAKVTVCPMADPSLLEGLTGRGFRATGFEDVLYRTLDDSGTFEGPPEGIVLGWVGAEDGEEFADTLARGFSAPEEPSGEFRDLFETSARIGGMAGILARVGGKPAGAGLLLVREGVAMLGGGATLPEYRGRGIQTALSHARLARAAGSGCGLAVIGAEPGSTSHRNAERLGFRVAYTKLVMHRDPA